MPGPKRQEAEHHQGGQEVRSFAVTIHSVSLTCDRCRLAEYIESEPLRKKAQQEAQRAKLEALERKLGISAGTSSSDPVAGKKHRLEDTEYIEQSREIVDNVKSAVSAGEWPIVERSMSRQQSRPSAMLRKKKKAKATHSPPAVTASTADEGPNSACSEAVAAASAA